MSDLHAKIMNLECNEPDLTRIGVAPAYRLGHRDARHAAAELAAIEGNRIKALEAALELARSWEAADNALVALEASNKYREKQMEKLADWNFRTVTAIGLAQAVAFWWML